MNNKKRSGVTLAIAILGIVLMLAGVGTLGVSRLNQRKSIENAADTVTTIRSLIPEIKGAVSGERYDYTMPMLEIGGENFIGIIEIPLYNTCLPICGTWNKSDINKYPCRFTGSAYDGSLVIGGSDNKGQFDFMKLISIGDAVYITDTAGNRFSYTVEDIEITKDISAENLCSEEHELTFYARNTYNLKYTVVRCSENSKK